MLKQKKSYTELPSVPASLERTPEPVTWEEVKGEKKSVLLRVESQSLGLFDEFLATSEAEANKAMESESRWSMPVLIPAFGVALGVLFFMVWTPLSTSPWPGLRTQGHAQLQWRNSPQSSTLQVKVPAPRTIRLMDEKHWELEAQGGTELILTRPSRRQAQVQLQRGSLVAHVTPRTMKQFDVSCNNGFSVIVKGTVFAVRQGKGWLRVEVMRGRVAVQRKGQVIAMVSKGQGYRFSAEEKTQRYPVPEQAKLSLSQLMRWLREQAPQHLMQYAKDIRSQQEWSTEQRRALLETIANLLARQKYYQQASVLWHQLYQWKSSGFEGQTALFQAAQNCRRWRSRSRRCVRLYRLWLKRFPKGMSHFHETTLYWYIRILKKRRVSSQVIGRLILQYSRRYPQGRYRAALKKLQ